MHRVLNSFHVLAAASLGVAWSFAVAQPEASLALRARFQEPVEPGSKQYRTGERLLQWPAVKTAIIICDMWDRHWCQGATARVAEMAPRMNETIKEARKRGVLIIHAPSGVIDFYSQSPQRRAAQFAPKVSLPFDLNKWRPLDRAKEGPLPIDDSDGGCDDLPMCPQGSPWKSQIAALEIQPEDIISDRGEEIYSVLQQRRIDNLILMGVHANMCVLGRPFGIRQMVSAGKHVVLMRDLTDTMYNSRKAPCVSHFVGTDLLVQHIERHWCPTVTSADLLGGQPFQFSGDRRPRVVFLIGETEYFTRISLPEFARAQLAWRGLRCTFVEADEKDPNNFAGWEAIKDADLLFVSVRRRTPPQAQMDVIKRHLAAGKPLAGLRTASHAWEAQPPDQQHVAWKTFDLEVLGAKYEGHYNNKPDSGRPTVVTVVPEATRHPVLTGVSAEGFRCTSQLYRSRNLAPTVVPLLKGSVEGEPQSEPVAWVNTTDGRRVFYASLGNPQDFQIQGFRRLLLNGILWALDHPIPPADAPLTEP